MGRRLSNTTFGFFLCSQGLCKALQELRAEMVATAEKNVIASAAQKEENLNVQILIDKQTKDLKVGFLPHHQHTGFCCDEEFMCSRGTSHYVNSHFPSSYESLVFFWFHLLPRLW